MKEKIFIPKICEGLEYHKDYHHTCNNAQICKKKISPDETCEACTFYKLREVKVAKDKIRHDLINMF